MPLHWKGNQKRNPGIAGWMHTVSKSGVQGCYTIFPIVVWRVTLTCSYLAATSSGFLLSQAFLLQRILGDTEYFQLKHLLLSDTLKDISFNPSHLHCPNSLLIMNSKYFYQSITMISTVVLTPALCFDPHYILNLAPSCSLLINSSQWCQVQADVFSWPCSPSLYLFTCNSTLSSDVEF